MYYDVLFGFMLNSGFHSACFGDNQTMFLDDINLYTSVCYAI